jgi:ribosomal protein S18 acetylase RimI-like enzyme
MEILWKQSPPVVSRRVARWSDRLKDLLAREGPTGVLRSGSRGLFSYVFDKRMATVFERSLDDAFPEYPPSIPIIVREITQEDIDRFRQPQSLLREHRVAEFAERLKTGRVGVIALADDRVAGYAWLSQGTELDRWLGIEVSMQEGEGYLLDMFIFPHFRRHRIYPSLQLHRFNCLRRLGCRIAYGIVAANNFPALKWHERLGFRGLRQIGYMKIMGMKRYVNRPLGNSGVQTH